jgi:hypothetical protein
VIVAPKPVKGPSTTTRSAASKAVASKSAPAKPAAASAKGRTR